MNRVFKVCVITVLSLIMVVTAFGQTMEERMQSMAAKNAESYVTPFVTAFGSALNSGWFYSAKPHKLLGFDIGLKAMMVTFPADQKTFEFDISDLSFETSIDAPDGNSYAIEIDGETLYETTSASTIFGDEESPELTPDTDAAETSIIAQLTAAGVPSNVISQIDLQSILSEIPSIPTPPGTGLEYFPFAVPQASIGLSIPMTPIKAEITGRYLPEIELDDFGKITFYGVGGRLALDPFIPIPMFPINITAGGFYQQLKVGDLMEANSTLLSLQAGKNLNLLVFGLGVYGSVGFESTNVDIAYTYILDDEEIPLEFSMTGENKMRYSVGGYFKLAIFNVNAEYAMGADNVLTAGVAIAIR